MAEVKVERETWTAKFDFILALMGFSIGLGNIWRFPYLCFKNGGGCFLIPYLICLVVAGVPVLVLEIALGQYTSQGAITAWKICPLFQGIGYAGVLVMQYINIYYTVILGWALFYMFASFQSRLPWSHCGNEWNTPNCVIYSEESQTSKLVTNSTILTNATVTSATKVSASQEYWNYRVLRLSDGFGEPGQVNWDLALCLLLAWIICYLCVCKGVKSSGKVVYFTATAPYLLLTAILIRGVTLPGAVEGIKFYLTPDLSRLSDGQVWIDAGTQVFFSYSIGNGTLTALGSYNKRKNNFYRDSILFTLFNSGTSFFGGFLIFSVLGFMAKNQGVDIKDVATSGAGLAFIVYPEAVAQMPLAPLWSALFFFMILLLGLDSEFVGIEGVVTAIVDWLPHHLRRGYRKELFTAFVCFIWFVVGLSMVTEGGMYVLQLFDAYSGSGSVLLVVVFCESLAIGWLYGRHRFYDDMENMLGFRINPWIGWCWCFFAPIFCLFIFIFQFVTYSPLSYDNYKYPDWGQVIGWLLTLSSLSLIPAVMIYKLIKTTGTMKERLIKLITPDLMDKEANQKVLLGDLREKNGDEMLLTSTL
ncbi:sodium- and chloride-dependent taurine transporter-like [Orbicella faveolata]|uniref:sodium- and chloride-dependent taurine transporter-like n=1 Tax=Orbicella faveolata TaxID=48498 RepID=UPI0009E47139|nr:sodium- and chloride-dependent taurine transporter-like [Orbicella faveolata]XP_020625268.1 sodium- and chloride-dependent taurine transporter-like [Orbicella faveolata]